MVARKVNVLHVEDNRVQQRMLASLLKALPEFDFAVTVVDNEEAALAEFAKGGIDFVLLDYQLAEGDGLQCLLRLRKCDRLVPIIAISATATEAVAADLIRGGADDYLSKLDLTLETFARSVRESLGRTELFRRHLPSTESCWNQQVELLFPQLCQGFLNGMGSTFLEQLEAFESVAREARLTPDQLRQQFENACRDWEALPGRASAKRLVRPLMLELFLRLFGAAETNDGEPPT